MEKYNQSPRQISESYNLAALFPELIKEWDYEKNGALSPHKQFPFAMKKVWWLCKKGHSWQALIINRTKHASNCPYCSGRSALSGFNDLATKFPEIAKEWDGDKNKDLTPSDVTWGSNRRVAWICANGHKWETTIAHRTREGKSCPYCAGKRVLFGVNDLESQYPSIALEWNYKKNEDLLPRMFSFGSGKKVWWICEEGHEWKTSIAHRTVSNSKCPYCTGTLPQPGVNDFASLFPALLSEWDYQKNGDWLPQLAHAYSGKKAWWICDKGHSWQATINDRTRKGTNCPYCSGYKVLPGFNDLSSRFPEIATQWNPTLNGDLTPQMVSSGSHKRVWWTCDCGYIWRATINDRTKHNLGCPSCSGYGRKVLSGFNDLATLCPEISKEWNYTKNGSLSPKRVSRSSNKNVWWICSEGHEWKSSINNRTNHNTKCPYCSGRSAIPGKTDLATLFPAVAKEWHHTKNGSMSLHKTSPFSGKKVWWICSEGHEWQAIIRNRTRQGGKCPYCTGRIPIPGKTDLATVFPLIAAQWDYEKNGTMTPETTTPFSGKKAWFLCDKNHSWRATIYGRTARGTNCPYCAGSRKVPRQNNRPLTSM